ncbi:MAG: amidohydrolase family protein [Acidobacteria bacterium]|nr:amidohydrolase family protein [Acidobacteriota bacterium]
MIWRLVAAATVFVALTGFSFEQRHSLAITKVSLIDATGKPAQSNMTVVVTGDRISAIGKTGKVKLPANPEIVDGSGKFLIPGLWDSHLHLTIATDQAGTTELLAPMLVAYGVTTVREMGGDWQRIQQLRKAIADGQIVGPRIFAPGPFVDGPQPADVNFLPVGNEAEARQAVRKLKADGVDFIKIQANLSPETWRAIVDESQKAGIPVVGHIPETVSAFDVARSAQRSVEHISPVIPGDAGIMLACSSRETELRAELAAIKKAAEDKNANRQQLRLRQRDLQRAMAASYDAKKCETLFALFVKHQIHVVPTAIFGKRFAPLDERDLPNDDSLNLIPASMRARWDKRRAEVVKASSPDDFAFRQMLFAKSRDLISAMIRAKVPLLTGTDALDGYVLPGASLHDELGLLVESGMMPMAALQSATRDAAKFMGKLDSVGTIESGKIADLILLDADPLQFIENTRRIHAVILGGKLISSSQLQTMKTKMETYAKEH